MTQEVCVYILGRRNIREARTVALSLHMSKYHMVNFSPYLQHGGTLQERSKFLYPANMHSNMAVQWKECHDVEPHKLLNSMNRHAFICKTRIITTLDSYCES